MFAFNMRIELVVDEDSARHSAQTPIQIHKLVNDIRRAAHAIEGSQPRLGDYGDIFNLQGETIGRWSLE